jgi:hypothetical protein
MVIRPQPQVKLKMSALQPPYVRAVDDGTYEVLIQRPGEAEPHILPYAFHTEEAGKRWIESRKGSARIEQALQVSVTESRRRRF